jgi:uncharacterized MnhB-related membrane protein
MKHFAIKYLSSLPLLLCACIAVANQGLRATFVAGGLMGLALTFIGPESWPIFAVLAAMLAPAVYSLVLSKQLERRGEL